ncbi:Cellulose synthase-like protein [Rhynchospora pubera]|uniref:Cellulose synthase-like protein n=1 Tax=Rhynchospora pubera TaxID=906938 RepID=A0AAV8E0R9_9POAL|nr:Cellulose synthase-like protein [Rhynchospora pubera]
MASPPGETRSESSVSTGYIARRDPQSGLFIPVEDSTNSSGDYVSIQVPAPVSLDDHARLEGLYLMNTMLTGGFATKTRAHGMPRKVEERPMRAPDICHLPGCNNKALSKDTCQCRLKICAPCFIEAINHERGKLCPGCKMPYGNTNLKDFLGGNEARPRNEERIRRPAPSIATSMDFDTESIYSIGGYRRNHGILGNARVKLENKENHVRAASVDSNDDSVSYGSPEGRLGGKRWRPLARKTKVASTTLSAYRLLVLVRVAAVAFFIMWRVVNVNNDAMRPDFVGDRRLVKREYDEFKVRINGLPEVIRKRSNKLNSLKQTIMQQQIQPGEDTEVGKMVKKLKATWMADETPWSGTWIKPTKEHARSDHPGIIQVMIRPPSNEPQHGNTDGGCGVQLNFTDVDVRLPMLIYLSREMRPGFDHNKKAGAMNALLRCSAVISNGPFVVDLDCDHYMYNSQAFREAMCFMMDRGAENVAFVQFPHRFEGIDPSDRYANHNRVFFDINMRALDGIQGPEYLGTCCMFRRISLYGFDPPRHKKKASCFDCCFPKRRVIINEVGEAEQPLQPSEEVLDDPAWRRKFGNSNIFINSIREAELNGRPLSDYAPMMSGRGADLLDVPYEPLTANRLTEAIGVLSCWYENRTGWGHKVGWIYGSICDTVITGYNMHDKGWCSVYCSAKPDGFRGTTPINLTDRLHQLRQWAVGSIEIFFSGNNALFSGPRMKFLQRIAYFNVAIYPFTSIFLFLYCLVPALSLFTSQFIVQKLSLPFLVYLLALSLTLCTVAGLEIKWSGITLKEWWQAEQMWMIGGTSAHLFAVFQGMLKVILGIEVKLPVKQELPADDDEEEFADLNIVKLTPLMIPPIIIMMVNVIAIAVGVSRAIYGTHTNWGKVLGGVLLSLWVLSHYLPFVKGLMGRRGRTPALVFIWAGLISITVALLIIAIDPPPNFKSQIGGPFSFP